uniref:Uncharacterized protein n=1 Tax=Pseudonaja textilis TaxID=8673 RepID=A0A670Z0H4_PSETE
MGNCPALCPSPFALRPAGKLPGHRSEEEGREEEASQEGPLGCCFESQSFRGSFSCQGGFSWKKRARETKQPNSATGKSARVQLAKNGKKIRPRS